MDTEEMAELAQRSWSDPHATADAVPEPVGPALGVAPPVPVIVDEE